MVELSEKHEAWKARLIFVARSRRFFDVETGMHRHGGKEAVKLLAGMYPDDPMSTWQAEKYIEARLFDTAEYVDYFPGKPAIVQEGECSYVNMWRGWNEQKGDIAPFLDMIARLFRSSPKDGETLLDMIAWRAQNPEPHINYAAILSGYEPDAALFCSAVEAAFAPYTVRLGNTLLKNPSRQWARDASLCVFMGGEEALKYSAIRETMMQFIVNPVENRMANSTTSQVNYLPVANRRFTMVTLPRGAESAIPTHGDIYFVVQTEKVGEEITERLRKFIGDGHGKRIMHWLLKRNLKNFQMPRSAPRTMLSNVIRTERMSPFERLGKEMMDSPVNRVAAWVSEAVQWAQAVVDKAAKDVRVGGAELGKAKSILETLPEVSIRPWYTSEEIAMMFPNIDSRLTGVHGSPSMTKLDIRNYVSRDLRAAGVPLLTSADNPMGFMMAGRYQYYFVVSDHDKWSVPITQEQFEYAYRNAPTYRDYVNELTRKAEASRMARIGEKGGPGTQ